MKKSTKIFLIVLQVFISIAFLAGAFGKLTNNPMEVEMFSTLHLSSTLMILGVIEALVAIMLWFKSTRTFAVLLGTAVLGGAVAESISFGGMTAALAPAVILAVLWLYYMIGNCGCHCTCEACKNCTVAKEAAPMPTTPVQTPPTV